MLLMAHDIQQREWREMLVDAMNSGQIQIPPLFVRTLRLDYMRMPSGNEQIQLAADKLTIQAMVEYLELALKCTNPLVENHDAKVRCANGRGVVGVSNVTIPDDIEHVLMVFHGALYSSEPFFAYEGIVHRKHDGIVVIFALNDAIFEGSKNVNTDVVVSIYAKPCVRHLESQLRGIHTLQDNVVNGKLFPDPHMNQSGAVGHAVQFPEGTRLNHLQRQTITECVNLNPPHPYVSFGTPGSGKSTTLAQLALWLLQNGKGVKILIVSQTNNACNVITEMLLRNGIAPTRIRRILARNYDFRTAPAFLRDVCFFDEQNEVFYVPKTDIQLKEFDIHVSTIGSVTTLNPLGKKFFDYIFFEEAGQISELDVLIPCAAFVSEKTKLIFAGDVQQLPPFTPSAALFELGYNIFPPTILRLSRLPIFRNNQRYMITLLDTYRAIPKLMGLYSEVSYRGRLVAHVPDDDTLGEKILRNKACLRWHVSLHGKEVQNLLTLSFSNDFEVGIVTTYVKRALISGVPPDEIGVITPYRAQVDAIRASLASVNASDVLVDTVEAFQGREKDVIIISMVKTERMGFLQDWRRMNTAITRVKKCLIIIGEPFNLIQTNTGGINNFFMRLFRQLKERDVFQEGLAPVNQLTGVPIRALHACITPAYDMGNRDPCDVEDEVIAEAL